MEETTTEAVETTETTEPVQQTPDPEAERLTQLLERICRQRKVVAKRQIQVDLCAAQLKDAKGSLEMATRELLALIDEREQPTLFPTADSAETSTTDAWRSEPIEVLNLPVGIVKVLQEAMITTLGAIATQGEVGSLTDIEGIGEAKAEKIADALEQYWREHPQTGPGQDLYEQQCKEAEGSAE
jgi:ERCC4-type nuclease